MSKFGTPFIAFPPGWTTVSAKTRYPAATDAVKTHDVSEWSYIGGIIGLNKDVVGAGVATFYWTWDVNGDRNAGSQGLPLTSGIVSTAQLKLENQGPYIYLEYEPFDGTSQLAATLFGTDAPGRQSLLCCDTLLFSEEGRALSAAPSPTVPAVETLYPCDYFTGRGLVSFRAWNQTTGAKVPEAYVTVHAADLTNVWYLIDQPCFNRVDAIFPMGTWCIQVHNPTAAPIAYSLAVTPLLS